MRATDSPVNYVTRVFGPLCSPPIYVPYVHAYIRSLACVTHARTRRRCRRRRASVRSLKYILRPCPSFFLSRSTPLDSALSERARARDQHDDLNKKIATAAS